MRAAMKLFRNSKGATAIEYALIAAFISVAAVGAFEGLGSKLNATFSNTSSALG